MSLAWNFFALDLLNLLVIQPYSISDTDHEGKSSFEAGCLREDPPARVGGFRCPATDLGETF